MNLIWMEKHAWIRYVMIAAGTFFMALGINLVYEPMQMVTGGFSGLSIVVKSLTERFYGGIPVWLTNSILNVPLFFIAWRMKGKHFVKCTLFATVSFTVALYVIPIYSILDKDYLMAAVCGGAITGVGLGLVFLTSTSTGGTDLLGALLQKLMPQYSVAQLLFVIDTLIVAIGMAVFGVRNGLYAIVAVFITSKIMDSILEGMKFAKQVQIITDDGDAVGKEILRVLDRGVTAIEATGMYSGKGKTMLYCIVSRKEVVRLTALVAKLDPAAFVIVSDAHEFWVKDL